MEVIYYRSCGEPSRLYRVQASSVPKAKGGGLDLSSVPAGKVSAWNADTKKWEAAELPKVGSEPDCVRHTKNAARVGV